uniref:Uncharacterized protein n=1 Tax=Erpetoichthys calabaricus TaxID=27687 RepID=A0A8C4TJ71_ERPCA
MDNSEVKQIMHGIWMGIAEISCEAAVVHPLFGIVGLVMKALSKQILYENKKTLNQIKKISVILQNDEIVKNIKYQFKTFQYMYEAEEKYKMDEADNFIRMFKECNRSMNLDSLYDSVMWENKIFGQPILEVYKTCSGNDPVVMKKLCTFLQCLFAEGLIALVAFKYVTNDNVDKCVEEWKEKIQNVDRKLAEVSLVTCK